MRGLDRMIAEVKQETKRLCPGCEQTEDDLDLEPIYECSDCGEGFSRSNSYDGNSHQCPSCMKFASKVADEGCPDCGEELEEREVYTYNEQAFEDIEELVEAIQNSKEEPPDWLKTELKELLHRRNEAERKKRQEQEKLDGFRQNYPLWLEYFRAGSRTLSSGSSPVLIKQACEATQKAFYPVETKIVTLAPRQEYTLLQLILEEGKAVLQDPEHRTYSGVPLACLEFKCKPKYHIGQVFQAIDISSRSCFHRKWFVKATITAMQFEHYGLNSWDWRYTLTTDTGKLESLHNYDIRIGTGQDPTKEYIDCPNKCGSGSFPQHIHYGETCPTCGYKFKGGGS